MSQGIVNETSYPNWIDIFNWVWDEMDHNFRTEDKFSDVDECIKVTNKIYAEVIKVNK